jgi:ANTAR domain
VPTRQRVDPPHVFTSLAEIVRQGSTPKEMYAAICVAATLTVPGCDHASLMVRRDGSCRTVAVSDVIARKIDKLELALDVGPCLDTLEDGAARLEPDLRVGGRWPGLAARVVAETPVRGALSVRVPLDRFKVAALNLFSDAPYAFDDSSLDSAIVLGAFATTATNAAAQHEEAETLRRGLTSNRAIGKAVGVLMMSDDVSDHDAFDILRQRSQAANVKLAEIASNVVRDRCRPTSSESA